MSGISSTASARAHQDEFRRRLRKCQPRALPRTRDEDHTTWDNRFLNVPTNVADDGLDELFPTPTAITDAGYNEDGLEQSYHARIQAIARAVSVTSWASLAANVAAQQARMSFLMTSQALAPSIVQRLHQVHARG